MIELDGIPYKVNTVQENVQELVTYINTYCENHDIRNSKGEVINIASTLSNPLYAICYGLSYLITIVQKLVYSAGCAFNIASSSDRQLLNIADIAKVHRRPATVTTIPCLVYAKPEDETELGIETGVQITKTLSATVTLNNTPVIFHPAFEAAITPGGVANIPLIAETTGSWNVPAGLITAFDTPVPNLANLHTTASIPGMNEETIAELRARLQQQGVSSTRLDRCAAAIKNLIGVTSCSIYFNYSYTSAEVINGITVPQRKALLVVQGYSDLIAETFYNYMLCETTSGPAERTIVQNFVTHANQQIPVYIITPKTEILNVTIYVGQNLTDDQTTAIKQAVMSLSQSLAIAQAVTSVMVLNAIEAAIPNIILSGAVVSGPTSAYGPKYQPSADTLLIFNSANISIEQAGD